MNIFDRSSEVIYQHVYGDERISNAVQKEILDVIHNNFSPEYPCIEFTDTAKFPDELWYTGDYFVLYRGVF